MIDKRQKQYQAFGEFLTSYVADLNHLADEGWCLLVEGRRDALALRRLGFSGGLTTISSMGSKGISDLRASRKVVILTDLDREGALLASRYVRKLSHDGLRVSLKERLRLKNASHGVFLHIENLARFAQPEL